MDTPLWDRQVTVIHTVIILQLGHLFILNLDHSFTFSAMTYVQVQPRYVD